MVGASAITLAVVGIKVYNNKKSASAPVIPPGATDSTGAVIPDARVALDTQPIDTSNIGDTAFPLIIGSRRKAVVLLQMALKYKYNYPVDVDGRLGEQTRLALIQLNADPQGSNLTVLTPFWKSFIRTISIDKNNYLSIVKDTDYTSLFSANPALKDIYNQYSS